MSTSTFSVSYAYTVTYVTTKMLLTLKEIIREVGLNPARFTDSWGSCERAISSWLSSRHLKRVTLEVYDPQSNGLVTRWDMDVVYASVGDGVLWVDTSAVRYAIAKAGLVPSSCSYDIILTHAAAAPDVIGWGEVSFRGTDGFKRYSVGATIGGNGLSAETAYWSR
ncbi:MAG: HORMA domain containing protein [Candidatus Binataceae bacterium]